MKSVGKIVVLGSGESGVGAAVLAKQKGFDVFVTDKGSIKKKYKDVLCKYEIKWEENQHTAAEILNATEVVISPGIPEKVAIAQKIKEANIPIISEIEFAARYTNAKLVCVTGSNGKTTTASLIYHILKKAGLNVGLGGNIGKSFALQVATETFDVYVLELSSFQLDGIQEFKPDVAVLLNITPDHLDRYNYNMQQYVDSKFRIVKNMTANDSFIYSIDDEFICKELEKRNIAAKKYPFSIQQTINNADYEGVAYLEEEKIVMSIHELGLQGKHNIYNSMASGVATKILEIRKEIIRESLSDFQNIEHRLEFVAKIHGIEFINDSKATNLNATWYALESCNNPVVWVAGGVDKGNNYNEIKDLVKDKVKAIVCLGADNRKLVEAFGGIVPIVETNSAEDAVRQSYRIGKKGDTVILSPACASFDLFDSYEDRGRQFKQAVREL